MGIIDSLIGGLFDSFNQASSNRSYLRGVRDTNANNLQIAREANKQSIDLFNAGNDFTEKMWNKSNTYNSPAAVRARLIQAGISPSAMSEASLSSAVSSVSSPSMQAAHMDAPAQTSNAWSPLAKAIGGAVNEYRNDLLLKEEVKRSRYDTEMKLLDRDFYFGEKERRLRKEEADIAYSGLNNQEKQARLADLSDELRHVRAMRSRVERAADDEHDNAIKTGQQIDANIASTYQGIQESLSRISHMSAQERVDWYRAQTERAVGSAQVANLRSQSAKLDEDLRQSKATFSADSWYRNNKSAIDQMDYQAKQALVGQAMQTLNAMVLSNELNAQKADGMLNNIARSVLGVDLEHVFSGTAGVNFRP